MLEENNSKGLERPKTGPQTEKENKMGNTNDMLRQALISRTKDKVKSKLSKEE